LLGDAVRRHRDPSAPEPTGLDDFVNPVAHRTGLDPPRAHRGRRGVLETLAERTAGGEADDIAEYLPAALRLPPERGKERTRGKPQRMSLDEFIQRIAQREEVPFEQRWTVLAPCSPLCAKACPTRSTRTYSRSSRAGITRRRCEWTAAAPKGARSDPRVQGR
jgi:uncharacterized protein (DUF2267 family)